MIRYYQKRNKELVELDRIQEETWIDIRVPFDQGELEKLANDLDVPLDYFTDSLDVDERSRYEREDEVELVIINTPVANDDNRDSDPIYITVPIGIVLTKGHIITLTSKDDTVLEKFTTNKVKNFVPSDRKKFILQIFEQNVLDYLYRLKQLNLKRNLIEQSLYESSSDKELRQLLRIEKSLVYFVNSLNANELLNLKMKRTDFLQIRDLEFHTDLFEDIIIDNGQALEVANVHTNILSSTMDAYASIISNNMNIFIHRLTIITIILMVPTLVASFYGMNLKYLPLQDTEYAFVIIILVSIALGIGIIWFFKRRKHF